MKKKKLKSFKLKKGEVRVYGNQHGTYLLVSKRVAEMLSIQYPAASIEESVSLFVNDLPSLLEQMVKTRG